MKKTYAFEIDGTIVKITTDKELSMSDVIAGLAKSLNGDDVNVEDCMYKGKKKYHEEIKITAAKPIHLLCGQSTTKCGHFLYTGGVLVENTTTDKSKVTCRNCLRAK